MQTKPRWEANLQNYAFNTTNLGLMLYSGMIWRSSPEHLVLLPVSTANLWPGCFGWVRLTSIVVNPLWNLKSCWHYFLPWAAERWIWLSLIVFSFSTYQIMCQYIHTEKINWNIRSINSPIKMRWVINTFRANQCSLSLWKEILLTEEMMHILFKHWM